MGGPPGSWLVGFIVTNAGTVPFSWDSGSQVIVIDSEGRSHDPVPPASLKFRTSATIGAATIAAAQTLRPILVFVLPATATPTTAVVAPFGPTGPKLRWSIS